MILNSNILNNKRSVSSFSVQILSIFTLSRRDRGSFSHNPHHREVFAYYYKQPKLPAMVLINPLTHQYRNNKSNSPKGGGSDGGMYKGRTDDVMKLLMIGFEGL